MIPPRGTVEVAQPRPAPAGEEEGAAAEGAGRLAEPTGIGDA